MRRHYSVLVPALIIAATRAASEDDSLSQCGSRDADIAIKACTAVIEAGRVDSESLPRIIAQRAGAYATKFNYDKAVKDYSHAIKLRPEFWIAFDGRGLAHANRLNFELAIKDYDQAIKLKPDAAVAYYHRGLAKFGLCDLDGADADIAKAREIDPHVGD